MVVVESRSSSSFDSVLGELMSKQGQPPASKTSIDALLHGDLNTKSAHFFSDPEWILGEGQSLTLQERREKENEGSAETQVPLPGIIKTTISEIHKGSEIRELLALMGPSGSGKTTLNKILGRRLRCALVSFLFVHLSFLGDVFHIDCLNLSIE
ncbi:hypothetical protein RND71_030637 [Anisodus tanguticus]|uniref:ABC transporter domain-containing protein n=1 Tax=Anisodus tanguticus TaxID=243964 RepID=A0AAE1V7I8_9SOLA|nr:hypothetical protein RND71_030637 [Anisodus tanguticus]